ncbi:MAG: TonB-dependent receptor [Flavobacteriales bacterium]|nr:TonB-dependent receptor [Flavobacteriales bacterium]
MFEVPTFPTRCAWVCLFTIPLFANAQQRDSLRTIDLRAAEVVGPFRTGVRALGDTLGPVILAGKRTESITLAALDADLSLNHARQVFGKVPGVTVWENDGSGIQLAIAARGLSPNRSWEFNMRQDGADISADAFGYPEAYYTPPMEGVERIDVVRGAASLAYGPQFGGLVNFIMKRGPSDRELGAEVRQTMGSYGLFDSYVGLGGTKGKVRYQTFLHHRNAQSWRQNSRYGTTTAHVNAQYTLGRRTSLGLSYTHASIEQQQPGGLTDVQFHEDARRSVRERNWMTLPWNVAAITLEHRPDEHTLVEVKLFGTLAERNSVGFMKAITQPDTIDRATGQYAPRQVDTDAYMNLGLEVRGRRQWRFFSRQAVLSIGLRGYGADNTRRQLGTGTTGTDPDMTVQGSFGRELDLATRNAAFYAESLLPLTDRLAIVPGARLEHIVSRVNGRINTAGSGVVDSGVRTRQRILLGIGARYLTGPSRQFYANFSQAYRPVLYSDLTPSATTDVIDPDLRDASGHNLDGGYRGTLSNWLFFDVGGFLVHYNDRIGTIQQNGNNYRTNIGTSVSKGVEAYVEADLLHGLLAPGHGTHMSIFISYAFTDAQYTRWNNPAIADNPALSVAGKRVEYAPKDQVRTGLTYRDKRLSATVQFNVIDGIYTDASNTEAPNASATAGWLPGYTVVDASATWSLPKGIALTAGVNNMLDERYATRRAGGYPGPGVLPGMGRNAFLTISARL